MRLHNIAVLQCGGYVLHYRSAEFTRDVVPPALRSALVGHLNQHVSLAKHFGTHYDAREVKILLSVLDHDAKWKHSTWVVYMSSSRL